MTSAEAPTSLTYDLTSVIIRRCCPTIRLWVTLFCTLFLAGCGDVQADARTLSILSIGGYDVSYLSVQDGLGAWQPLTAGSAPARVTLTDAQGRYGVLSLCLDTATGNLSVDVQYGVVSETPVVSITCSVTTVAAAVSVSGKVKGLSKGEYGTVYLGGASALVDSAAPTHRLELPSDLPEVRYNLVASRYRGSARVPSRLVLEPGLAVAATDALEVDFDGPFSFRPDVAQLSVAGVRPGELLSGSVELVTGGTVARVGEYTGGDALLYARIPESVVRLDRLDSVSFRAAVQSFSYNDRTKAGSSRSLSRTLPHTPEKPARITLPEPLELPKLTLRGSRYIRPEASWRLHPAGTGVYTQFYSQIQAGHTVSYRLRQSSAWLAGGAPRYALPDFNVLPGWEPAWNLVRSEELFWDVSFTQQTPVKELLVSRSGVLAP